MPSRSLPARVVHGDWQTPLALAAEALRVTAAGEGVPPASVLEPTCGEGAFLQAAAGLWPAAQLLGFEINATHAAQARLNLAQTHAQIVDANFFTTDWRAVVSALPHPVWVVGNPPWVTNAVVGALGGTNLPQKQVQKGAKGLAALTGKSNFDISLYMLLRLLEALQGVPFCLSVLCKAQVARQLLRHSAAAGWAQCGALYKLDAMKHFNAAVDAVLLVVRPAPVAQAPLWPVYNALSAMAPSSHLGFVAGELCSDVAQGTASEAMRGPSTLAWRSGIKHDCAKVMEFRFVDGHWRNGFGEAPGLEDEGLMFPLLKGSVVAAGRAPQHKVLVTQRTLGTPTQGLQQTAPRSWAYLQAHEALFLQRKSRIYQGQPAYALFGVGPYSFAPFKVAICGLYKKLSFRLVEPQDERPVMFDDTCYFLPCQTREQAAALVQALNGDDAQRFFSSRVFWDMKRPISKAVLAALCLDRLLD